MNTERGHHSKELCTDGDKQHQNWHTGLLTLHDATDDHHAQQPGLGRLEQGSWVMGHSSPTVRTLRRIFGRTGHIPWVLSS